MTIEQFNILNNHIGYGNPEAEIVFMGLEEGCKENNLEDNYHYRFNNQNSLNELSEYHLNSPLDDMNQWFIEPRLQSTWGQYCKIMLLREGAALSH